MESTWNSRGVQYRAEVAQLEQKLRLTEQVGTVLTGFSNRLFLPGTVHTRTVVDVRRVYNESRNSYE